MARAPNPSRSVSPVVRLLFDHVDASGRSQNMLAAELGHSPSLINSWRRGKHAPSIINAELLADRLGLEIIVRRKA